MDAVRAKIQGRTLTADEIGAIVNDLVHYRYSDMETAAFLIGSASFLTSDELLSLTNAMAQAGTKLAWKSTIVVDKHSIGGIPGNRTSMIIVPIVAAHGLTIPKLPPAPSRRRQGRPTRWRCWHELISASMR